MAGKTMTAEAVGKLQSPSFPLEEFAARRAKVRDAIGPEAAAVLQGAPPPEGFRLFRQDNDFHYLTGFRSAGACMLLSGADGRFTVYLPSRSDAYCPDGEVAAIEDADAVAEAAGADAVRPLSEMAAALSEWKSIYVPLAHPEGAQGSWDELIRLRKALAADPWDGGEPRHRRFARLVAERCPRASIRDLSPVLAGLRVVKSPREVAHMARAGALTARAVTAAMRATRAGMREHELQAVALHIYLRHGAAGEGYRSIVPSGTERIWNAHYMRNDGLLADGDLVLMDTAPDLDNYTSDIGRMWPVSGSYGSVQRELYGFMVEYHRTLLRLIRPGVSAEQVTQEAAAAMEPIVRATRFSAAAHREAAERCLTFRGHLSHPVGMAVHDVGGYWGGVLQPGHVFAVDPQMWVPEERLYIRVEDTVAVTDDGILNLTADAPAHPDDIEDAMRSPLEFGEL